MFSVEHVFRYRGEYAEETEHKFVTVFLDCDVPHRNTLQHFIKKFRGTRPVAEAQRSGGPEF